MFCLTIIICYVLHVRNGGENIQVTLIDEIMEGNVPTLFRSVPQRDTDEAQVDYMETQASSQLLATDEPEMIEYMTYDS